MKRVAVVEDNPDIRFLVRAILQERVEVREYGSGRAALAAIAEDPPDLVLLDISLPEMDGTEVLRRLREDPATATLPVVALTAHAMAGDRERFLRTGFDRYLAKPIVDVDELVSLVEQLLGLGEASPPSP